MKDVLRVVDALPASMIPRFLNSKVEDGTITSEEKDMILNTIN